MKRLRIVLVLLFLFAIAGIVVNQSYVRAQGTGIGGEGDDKIACSISQDCAEGLSCLGGICIVEDGEPGSSGCSSGSGCATGQWCTGPGSSGTCEPAGSCCLGAKCGILCAPPMCGNSILNSVSGEECDDGNHINGDGCDATCHLEVCGNGIYQPWLGEQCDDSGTTSGDGCSSACQIEQGYTCDVPSGTCSHIIVDDLCSEENQIILKLSAPSNAHGELWNGAGDYSVEVCYEEIFGEQYTGVNPHVCSAQNDNLVLKLSSPTNAHAQTPESTTYTSNVCFGDLECRSVELPGLCDFGAGEREVVTLSAQTNAHLETNSSDLFTSGYRICCKIGTPGVSTGPEAIISNPVHRHIYFSDVNIAFDGSSSTVPGGHSLTYLWTVTKNGVTEIVPSPTTATFDKIFTTPGMRTITLKVTDTVTGLSDETQIAILVVSNDDGVFAFINKPFHKQVLPTQESPYIMDFAADDSYIVEVLALAGACPTLNCLGGYCIDTTDNVPSGCSDPDDSLTVQSAPPQTPGAGDFSKLFFNWTFGQGSQIVANFGNFSHKLGSFLYESKSNSLGDKWIKLNVSYDSSPSIPLQSSLSDFNNRTFTLGQCINGGNQFIQIDAGGEYVATHDTLDTPFCAGADGTARNGDDCCPAGHICTLTGSLTGCQPADITSCEDYTEADDCEDDVAGVTESPLSPGYQALVDSCVLPADVGSVKCVWDDFDDDDVEECKVELSCHQGFSSDPVTPTCPSPIYGCYLSETLGECDASGFTTISYTPGPIIVPGLCPGLGAPNDCSLVSTEVPCGLLNFEVSFFNYSQFILSALAIIFAYLLISFRKRV